jgi:hypothetical protein
MIAYLSSKGRQIKAHINKFDGWSAGYLWILGPVVPALVLWHFLLGTDGSIIYFAALFFIPIVGALWFAPILFEESMHVSQLGWIGLATLVQVLSWVFYILLTSPWDLHPFVLNTGRLLPWANLLVTAGLVGTAFLVTRLIMTDVGDPTEATEKRDKFTKAMRERPLLTLLLFLVLFLDVTFSLVFSLAVQDIVARRDEGEGVLEVRGVPAVPGKRWDDNPCEQLWGTQVISQVYFEKNKNIVHLDKTIIVKEISEVATTEYSESGSVGPLMVGEAREIEGMTSDEKIRLMRERNSEALARIIRGLKCVGSASDVRVRLVGRTDEDVPREEAVNFSSNYELGHARIEATRQVVLQMVEELSEVEVDPSRITWTESTELGVAAIEEPKSAGESAVILLKEGLTCSVIFLVPDPPRQPHPNLLDYAYFTIYTITTTGYGDIIPVSLFAKFVASVANLYELFFIVIFFNVLLSFARSRGEDSRPNLDPPRSGEAAKSP